MTKRKVRLGIHPGRKRICSTKSVSKTSASKSNMNEELRKINRAASKSRYNAKRKEDRRKKSTASLKEDNQKLEFIVKLVMNMITSRINKRKNLGTSAQLYFDINRFNSN